MIKNDFNMIYVITKKRNPSTLIEKKECWSTLRRRKWRVFRMKPNFGYNFIYENSSMKILFVLLSFRENGKKKDSCLVYDNQTRMKFSLFVKSLFYILLFINSFILFSRFDSNVEKTRLERKKFHRFTENIKFDKRGIIN